MLKSAAKYFKHMRISKSITSSEFAKFCNISRTYLSQIENCKRIPSRELLTHIFSKLGISFESYFENYKKIEFHLSNLYKGLIFVNTQVINENIQWLFQNKLIILNSEFSDRALLLMSFYYLENECTEKSDDILKYFNLKKGDKNSELNLEYLQLFHLQEGIIEFKNNNFDSSITKLQNVLKYRSDPMLTALALYYISQVYKSKKSLHLAIESLQKSIELFSLEINHYRLTTAQISYANLLRKIGNYSAALRSFESILYSNDFKYDNAQKEFLLKKYIKLKVYLHQYADAISLISFLEETSVPDYSIEFMKTICLYKLNERINANMVVDRFMRRNKENAPTYCTLMKYLKLKYNNGHIDTLVTILEKVDCEKCSMDVEIAIYKELVELYENLFKYKKSNYYLKKLLEHTGLKGDKIYEENYCN